MGSIQETKIPERVYIAGVSDEGTTAAASPGQFIYLNGPGVSALKPGDVQRVMRAEGRVRNPETGARLGTYFRDIGTIRIESVQPESAIARVTSSCEGMMVKGDVVVANVPGPTVEFSGNKSNEVTPVQEALSSVIMFAKDDVREMAAGNFCFIPLGRRDGVKPGDHFIVFRSQPGFNSDDMSVLGTAANSSYSHVRTLLYRYGQNEMLRGRTLPPRILGDIVIVEAGGSVSTGKIINSMSEIHRGDRVVKK